jgi:hypothetical protein
MVKADKFTAAFDDFVASQGKAVSASVLVVIRKLIAEFVGTAFDLF